MSSQLLYYWAILFIFHLSIGYQKKGWTDGEIGAEWIKIFDEQTKHKVKPGEYRLLLVDGHNSHYTIAFLLYAREHLILVLCYPSHTTHIYQGLDVVIFSVLKRFIYEERDKHERQMGQAMDKSNFLQIYGRAHIRALTVENIKQSFKKTGVWPFNPKVITDEMLAPSKQTAVKGHLPIPADDPATETLADLIRELAIINDNADDTSTPTITSTDMTDPTPTPLLPSEKRHQAINKAMEKLAKTKLSHLVTTTLTTHLDPMPKTTPQATSLPTPSPFLDLVPENDREVLLLAALRESQAQNQDLINRNLRLQTGNVLNEVYLANTRARLEAKDEKRKKKKNTTGVIGTLNGHAVLVTGDTFYEARVEHERQKRAEERAKDERRDARAAFQAAKIEWEKEEEARKRLKEVETEKYKVAVASWEKAKAKALAKPGARPSSFKISKPKMGPVPKKKLSPKLKDFIEAEAEASSSGEEFAEASGGDDDDD